MPVDLKAIPFPKEELGEPFIPPVYRKERGSGFAFCGSLIVDNCTKLKGQSVVNRLTLIDGRKVITTGGLVPNDSIAMKILCPDVDVLPVGLIGEGDLGKPDADGILIMDRLFVRGISCPGLVVAPGRDTSFTYVPTEQSGHRSFHHSIGACEDFGVGTFPFTELGQWRIVLLGYINLLPKLMACGGKEARAMITEIQSQCNFVGVDFTDTFEPGFEDAFCSSVGTSNFLLTNEDSLAHGMGIDVHDGDKLLGEKLLLAAETAIDRFPRLHWIIVHWPGGSMFYDCKHRVVTCPVHELKEGDIVGKTGAGDNCAVGSLAAAYKGKGPFFALRLGNTAAEKSLGALSATDASGTFEELKEFDSQRRLMPMDGILAEFYPAGEPLDWTW